MKINGLSFFDWDSKKRLQCIRIFFSYGIVGDYFTQTPVDIKRDYSSLIKELNGMLCISHPIKVLKRAKQTSLMIVKIILKIRMLKVLLKTQILLPYQFMYHTHTNGIFIKMNRELLVFILANKDFKNPLNYTCVWFRGRYTSMHLLKVIKSLLWFMWFNLICWDSIFKL